MFNYYLELHYRFEYLLQRLRSLHTTSLDRLIKVYQSRSQSHWSSINHPDHGQGIPVIHKYVNHQLRFHHHQMFTTVAISTKLYYHMSVFKSGLPWHLTADCHSSASFTQMTASQPANNQAYSQQSLHYSWVVRALAHFAETRVRFKSRPQTVFGSLPCRPADSTVI